MFSTDEFEMKTILCARVELPRKPRQFNPWKNHAQQSAARGFSTFPFFFSTQENRGFASLRRGFFFFGRNKENKKQR
jgi:hypothetical protein